MIQAGNRPFSYSEKEPQSNERRAIEALTPLDRTLRMKMYKNIARLDDCIFVVIAIDRLTDDQGNVVVVVVIIVVVIAATLRYLGLCREAIARSRLFCRIAKRSIFSLCVCILCF